MSTDDGTSRVSARPLAFGVTLVLGALGVFAARASTNDPAVAGLIWTAVLGLVVLGLVWPPLAMRSVRVELLGAPTDSIVGKPETISVRFSTSGLVNALSVQIEGSDDWFTPALDEPTVLPLAVLRRGVFTTIGLTVVCDGPLGMAKATRTLTLTLDRRLMVGPHPIHQTWSPEGVPESGTSEHLNIVNGSGTEIRSVRPYRSGDPAHLVHWPSSARIGSLVVREMEPPVRPGIVIVIALRGRSALVEQSIAEAAGLARAVLRANGGVMLCTHEEGRPVAAEVTGELQLSRRLAAAAVGEPGVPPGSGGGARWPTRTFAP